MDIDILKDDNLIDTLNAAQMYSMELWIENIDDDSGKSRHINVHEETGSKLEDSDSKTTVEGKVGNSTSKSLESMPTIASSKPNKNSYVDGEGKKPDPKQKKKESKKEKEETEKKSIYTLEESTGDYILPSGLKPFRVRFTLFNRNVTLTQLDYEKITQIRQMLQGNATTSTTSFSTKNASMGSEQEDIKKPGSSKEDVQETASSVSKITSREKRPSIERGSASEKSKSNNSQQTRSRQYHTEPSDQLSAATTVKRTSRNGSPGASERTSKMSAIQFTKLLEVIGKTQECDYKVNVGELNDLLEEDAFVPQSENVMNKGACVTVAMAPMLVIQTLQSGSIQITVDRFGGRKEDEGDPIGIACIKIPSDWQETVLHTATNPRIAPVILKINNKVSIEERPDNKTIGTLDYTLILTCYSGCVTSEGMPTFLGLCVSLAESKQTSCHKPMVRDNITVHPLKRKAMNEDYEKIFKGHPNKMRKIC